MQSIIHFGKIARKHKLTNVSLETLNRIHTIPSVPVIDCFQTIRQKIKCYLQLASMNNKSELQGGLMTINHTDLSAINNKEMNAEIYALKGMLYHLSSKYEFIYLEKQSLNVMSCHIAKSLAEMCVYFYKFCKIGK